MLRIRFRLVEVIPTVSLAMGYKLASHVTVLFTIEKLPKNKSVSFLLKCLNLQKQEHNVYSCVCLLFNAWTFILLYAQINGSTTWVFVVLYDVLFVVLK